MFLKTFTTMPAKEFKEIDPYHPENLIEGIIYDDNDRYGDLLIKTINGINCEQYIHATPKFFYPGDQDSPIRRGKLSDGFGFVYDKLDGTNILRFSYQDQSGKIFITYKTRLSPFVRKNIYQNFKLLWDRMLEKYPIINELPPNPYYAFELYGYINPIIISYKIPIEIAHIYCLNEGKIMPPDHSIGIPLPKLFYSGNVSEQIYQEYESFVEKKYLQDKGMEGVMFYCKPTDQSDEKSRNCISSAWKVYKCKSITLLADSKEHTLSKNEIRTTAMNAMEIITDMYDLVNATKKLLEEVYTKDYIEFQHEMIEEVVTEVVQIIKKEQEIIAKYQELQLDIINQKARTMQTIMQYFPKRESSFVYTTIKKYTT